MVISRSKGKQSRLNTGIARRFFTPAVCLLVLVSIALVILSGSTAGLYALAIVTLFLMATATQNAWSLLVGSFIFEERMPN